MREPPSSVLSTELKAAPAPRRRCAVWRIVLLLTLCSLGWWFYHLLIDDRGLKEALAEADRLDPGWRFEELEAARKTIPEKENSARLLLSASSSLPALWLMPANPASGRLEDRLWALTLNDQLSEPLIQESQALLAGMQRALPIARRLADFPWGRYDVNWNPDFINTPLGHLQKAWRIAVLLNVDAILRAQQGDTEGALASCRAASNAGRSIGDEPTALSQHIRVGCQGLAVRGAERTLAQGTPSCAALERLQQLLEMEAAEPALLRAARAQRAAMHHLLEFTKNRRLDRKAFALQNPWKAPDSVVNVVDMIKARACQAAYLRFFTEYVEIAKLAPEEVRPRLDRLGKPRAELPPIVAHFLRDDDWWMVRQMLSHQALLHCAITGLALKRATVKRSSTGRGRSLIWFLPIFKKCRPTPLTAHPCGFARWMTES